MGSRGTGYVFYREIFKLGIGSRGLGGRSSEAQKYLARLL
jgi:hypothetical protein